MTGGGNQKKNPDAQDQLQVHWRGCGEVKYICSHVAQKSRETRLLRLKHLQYLLYHFCQLTFPFSPGNDAVSLNLE